MGRGWRLSGNRGALFGRADTNTYSSFPPVSITPTAIQEQSATYLCSIRKADFSLKTQYIIQNDSSSKPSSPKQSELPLLIGQQSGYGDDRNGNVSWATGIVLGSNNYGVDIFEFADYVPPEDESESSSSSSSESVDNLSESSPSTSSESVGNESSSSSSDLSSSSSMFISSSSSDYQEPTYDPQKIYVILADQSGHHNLIPFSYAVDSNAFSDGSVLPFSFSNASMFTYSNIYPSDGIIQQFSNQQNSLTYVPQPDEAKYIHTNEIYVDIIETNSDTIGTTYVSSFENGLHKVEPKESFMIPKFSWSIANVYANTLSNTYSLVLSEDKSLGQTSDTMTIIGENVEVYYFDSNYNLLIANNGTINMGDI